MGEFQPQVGIFPESFPDFPRAAWFLNPIIHRRGAGSEPRTPPSFPCARAPLPNTSLATSICKGAHTGFSCEEERPGVNDFNMAALIRLLLDGLLTLPETNIRAAIDTAPVEPGPGLPPLEVRDVIFG